MGDRRREGQGDFKEYSFRQLMSYTNNFQNILHRGDSGTLYKGTIGERITEHPKYVVIKRFKEDDLDGHQTFLEDLERMRQISRPDIVKIKGSYVAENIHILIYEYVPAKSLKYFLEDDERRRNLLWTMKIYILCEVAQALVYLHENNIAYRDLKSSGILVDENNVIKLADFGFVRDNIDGVMVKKANRIIGTPGYVDPNSFETGHLSPTTDVYSFGIIIFEVITGRIASSSHGAEALMQLVYNYSTNNNIVNFIDRELRGVNRQSVVAVAEVAYSCVASQDERITITKAQEKLQGIVAHLE